MEDRKGTPFAGPAGQLLRGTLRRVGLADEDGCYFNIVSCFPHGPPPEESQAACRVNLQSQWKLMLDAGVRHVLIVGSKAMSQLAPGAVPHRLRSLALPLKGATCYFTWHPSYVLRVKEEYKTWEQQLSVFSGLVHGLSFPQDTLTDLHTCVFCGSPRITGKPYCSSRSHARKWERAQGWMTGASSKWTKLEKKATQERLL